MELSKTVDVIFHGVEFIITITADADHMIVEAEETKTGRRWRGDYTSKYIEDVTQKTGNFKKFTVFVKMLINSLENSSESVFVDLLTFQDLEMLKARKGKQCLGQSSNMSGIATNNAKLMHKRYLIMTYTVEFDRIHYPLPLSYDESPDPNILQATISRLRTEIEVMSGSQGPGSNISEVTTLVRENERLKSQLSKQQDSSSMQRKPSHEIDDVLQEKTNLEQQLDDANYQSNREIRKLTRNNEELQVELDRLRDEMDKVIDQLEAESEDRNSSKSLQRENEKLRQDLEKAQNAARKYKRESEAQTKEVSTCKTEERKYKQKIKQLETELETALRARGNRQASDPIRKSPSSGSFRAPSPRINRAPSPSYRAPSPRLGNSNRAASPRRNIAASPKAGSRAASPRAMSRGNSGQQSPGIRSPARKLSNGRSPARKLSNGRIPGSPSSRRSLSRDSREGTPRRGTTRAASPGARRASPNTSFGKSPTTRKRQDVRKPSPVRRKPNFFSDSDDENKQSGPMLRSGRKGEKSPGAVNVSDIDERLNRLQDLLKFAKS